LKKKSDSFIGKGEKGKTEKRAVIGRVSGGWLKKNSEPERIIWEKKWVITCPASFEGSTGKTGGGGEKRGSGGTG